MSAMSLKNHYGTMLDRHNIEVYSLLDPIRDEGGTLIYPGWDGGNSESGVFVSNAFKELLLNLRDSKDVGLMLIDHYGKWISDAAKFYSYFKAQVPLDGKLEPSQWTSRANLINDVDHLVRNTVMDGGWTIATGSRDQREGEAKTTFSKNEGEKMKVKKEVVPSTWQEKVHFQWANTVQAYKLQLQTGDYTWQLEVEEGRHPMFPLGGVIDSSGRHLGAFQMKELVKFPEPEEPKLAVLPSSLPKQPLKPMSVS